MMSKGRRDEARNLVDFFNKFIRKVHDDKVKMIYWIQTGNKLRTNDDMDFCNGSLKRLEPC